MELGDIFTLKMAWLLLFKIRIIFKKTVNLI